MGVGAGVGQRGGIEGPHRPCPGKEGLRFEARPWPGIGGPLAVGHVDGVELVAVELEDRRQDGEGAPPPATGDRFTRAADNQPPPVPKGTDAAECGGSHRRGSHVGVKNLPPGTASKPKVQVGVGWGGE